MNIASTITFDSAEREYNEAWSAPSSTRFELPPVDVNKVLKERYRVSPEQGLTRAMIWDMETRKAWDPLTYIPYVVSQARSWGRTTLRDGSSRFSRSSMQRGWITPEEGRVLEDFLATTAKQPISSRGRPQRVEESGNTLVAIPFQPLFHVRHAVGGSEPSEGRCSRGSKAPGTQLQLKVPFDVDLDEPRQQSCADCLLKGLAVARIRRI